MYYKINSEDKPGWINISYGSFDTYDTKNSIESIKSLGKYENEVKLLEDLLNETNNPGNGVLFKINSYEYLGTFVKANREPHTNNNPHNLNVEAMKEFYTRIYPQISYFQKIIKQAKFKDLKLHLGFGIKSFLDILFKSSEIINQINTQEIEVEEVSQTIGIQSLDTAKGYICIDARGFVGHKGQAVAFSESRIFSSPQLAQKRFPNANIFPIELKIVGPMLKHPNGLVSDKANEVDKHIKVNNLHTNLNEKLQPEEKKLSPKKSNKI